MTELTNVKAIVIDSKNYKEKDKLLTLFTLEKGVIFANLKGVKSLNAKLSMAKEIFCFADYIYSTNGQINTITTASIVETFFDITKDYDRYNCGCNILSIIKTVCNEGEPNKMLFIETLHALKSLAYSNINEQYVLLKFLINTFSISGYDIKFDKCNSCGGEFVKKYFDFSSGGIVCNSCKSYNSVELENVTLSALRLISENSYDKLANIKLAKNSEQKALKLLCENFENKFDKKLNFYK